ncbi:MAG TPA: tRNA-dihydrouridine synthase [Candidatus Saccharimonadales bacterium]
MKSFWSDLPRPFFVLAPMETVTDVVFRHVVANAAPPDVYFTEFVNAASFCSPQGQHSTQGRLAFSPDEQPMVAQIWGTNPENFAQMGKALAKMGFAGIDINMGCPAKDVVKTGACSALIENPSLAGELIAAAKESGLPVSVKTRIGFKVQKTEEWSSFLLKQDLAALTIHARTQKEMSKVPARWEEIAKVVQLRNEIAPQTPIIGNGDVCDRQHGEELVAQYGVDGVMIGRGIFHNPFAFETTPRQHTREELLALLDLHLGLHDKESQEMPRRYDPLKRFFKIYVRDFPGASELRDKLMHTSSTADARLVLTEHLARH